MFSFSKKLIKNGFLYTQKRGHNVVLVKHMNSLPKFDIVEESTAKNPIEFIEAIPFESKAHPGTEPSLNYSLGDLHIHPQYEAFGNAKLDDILKNAYGKKEKNNSLTVDAFPIPKFDKLVLKAEGSTTEFDKDVQNFSEVFAKRVLKEIGYHVSTVPQAFVQDSNVGSYKNASCNLRVVTDNSVTALFLRNIMFKMPKKRLPSDFVYEGSVTHAPCYHFQPPEITEEFYGPKPSDLGLKMEEFTFVNEKTNNIIISAISDTKILFDAMVAIVSKRIIQKEAASLMLESDSYITEKGEVLLFLNKENSKEKIFGTDLNSIYGGNHNIWSADGLSRCWRGIMTERETVGNSEAEEFIEKVNSKLFRVTKPISGVKPNLVQHPKKLILCVNDDKVKGLTKVTEAEGIKYFQDGFTLKTQFGTIPSKEQTDKFAALIEHAKPEIYLLNVSKTNEKLSKNLEELKG